VQNLKTSKPCNFKASKVARFFMGSKDAPQKMQSLGAIKKWQVWTFRAKTQKWRKTPTDSAATEAK